MLRKSRNLDVNLDLTPIATCTQSRWRRPVCGGLWKVCFQTLSNLSLQSLCSTGEIERSPFGGLQMGCPQELYVHGGQLAFVAVTVAS